MKSTREENIEMNITSFLILGASLFLGVLVHWIFFLFGLISIIIQRAYKDKEGEVRKWINEKASLLERKEKPNENRLRRIK